MYICKYCGSTFEEHVTTCPNCAGNAWWVDEKPMVNTRVQPIKPPQDLINQNEEKDPPLVIRILLYPLIVISSIPFIGPIALTLACIATTILVINIKDNILLPQLEILSEQIDTMFVSKEEDAWGNFIELDKDGTYEGWALPFN